MPVPHRAANDGAHHQPETLAQARRFEAFFRSAVRAGLCRTCATQHAYGRQHGFTTVNTPCNECHAVMAAWPSPRSRGWAHLPPQ